MIVNKLLLLSYLSLGPELAWTWYSSEKDESIFLFILTLDREHTVSISQSLGCMWNFNYPGLYLIVVESPTLFYRGVSSLDFYCCSFHLL